MRRKTADQLVDSLAERLPGDGAMTLERRSNPNYERSWEILVCKMVWEVRFGAMVLGTGCTLVQALERAHDGIEKVAVAWRAQNVEPVNPGRTYET